MGVSGSEGAAVALFLARQKIPFIGYDFAPLASLEKNFNANHLGYTKAAKKKVFEQLWALREQFACDQNYLKNIANADLIFVSQNWEAYPPNAPLKKLFARAPEKFATLTQLYFALFPGKILAITGTNGKSTTSKLTAEIMLTSRHRTYFTGNDRRNVQILDQVDKWTPRNWLVIEVSNRQLKWPLPRPPEIGVITNVTRNHLDEYGGSFARYAAGKLSLIKNQQKQYFAVLNADDRVTAGFAKKIASTPLFFSTHGAVAEGAWVADGVLWHRSGEKPTRICRVDDLQIRGNHNLANALAALTATRAAGVDWTTIRRNLKAFRGLPQRLEIIAKRGKIQFINDTASTTPESTIAALSSFPAGSVHLICGGDNKGMTYHTLAAAAKKWQLKSVVCLQSPVASELARLLGKQRIAVEIVTDLPAALRAIHPRAMAGDTVLLSPAGAYFCYFAKKIPLGGRGFEQFVKALF